MTVFEWVAILLLSAAVGLLIALLVLSLRNRSRAEHERVRQAELINQVADELLDALERQEGLPPEARKLLTLLQRWGEKKLNAYGGVR